jgi:ABC-type lipoprotein release transport system permease subunit
VSAVWLRTRALLRRRWRAWVGIGFVLGILAGVVMSLAIGADTSDNAYPKFVRAQNAADVVMAGKSGFGLVGSVDLDEVDKLIYVSDRARAFAPIPFSARIGNGETFGAGDMLVLASADNTLGHRIERWKMLKGREADPRRVDEATASFELAKRFGLSVGDSILFRFYDADTFGQNAIRILGQWPGRLDALARTGKSDFIDQADGPFQRITVTGIEASPLEFPPLITDLAPLLHLTPAFYNKYATTIAGSPVSYLKLSYPDDLRAFQLAVEKLANGQAVSFISTLPTQSPKVQRSVHAESLVLATLAGLVALAGAVALAQALTRQAFAESTDDEAMRAIGMRRGQLIIVSLLRSTLIALVAVVVGCIGAWLASPLFLLSLARKAGLERGLPVHPRGLLIGAGSILVFTLLVGLVSALLVTRPALRGVDRTGGAAARVLASVAPPWTPLTALLGARFAVTRARRSAPAWIAVVSIALCVAVLTLASTFAAHLQRDLDEKHRYGWNWDVRIGAPALPDIGMVLAPSLEKQPGLTGLSVGAVTQVDFDKVRVDVAAIDPLVGDALPTISEGRAPVNADEIVLGGRTMDDLHTDLGRIVKGRIGERTATYRVVGRGIFPEFGDTGQLGTGAMTTVEGVRRLSPTVPRAIMYIKLSGPDKMRRAEQLSAVLSPLPPRYDARPEDLVNLSRGGGVVIALAVLVTLLAFAILLHTVVTSVRGTRRSHATLRALGYSRRQSRLTVLWQTLVIAVSALIVGLPVGLVVGRGIWQAYANRLGIESDPFVPLVPISLAVAGTLVIALVAALVPAFLVTRTNTAENLRAGA